MKHAYYVGWVGQASLRLVGWVAKIGSEVRPGGKSGGCMPSLNSALRGKTRSVHVHLDSSGIQLETEKCIDGPGIKPIPAGMAQHNSGEQSHNTHMYL
jgi:hypothetical protein